MLEVTALRRVPPTRRRDLALRAICYRHFNGMHRFHPQKPRNVVDLLPKVFKFYHHPFCARQL
jgi:hypothetical protein